MNIKRKALLFFATILILVLSLSMLVACVGKKNDETGTTEVVDMLGRTHNINLDNINRVVCIGAGSLRLYTYVGDMSKIVAVEAIEENAVMSQMFISKRPYQVANETLFKSLIAAGKTVGQGGPKAQVLNAEAIINNDPDIVFSTLSLTAEELSTAEAQIGCPIITLKYGSAKAFSNEMIASINLVGKIMKADAKATTLTTYMSELKADLTSKKITSGGKKVYLACNSNWGTKGFLSTSKNYSLFSISGIENVMDEANIALVDGMADLEAAVSSDADVIILDAGGLATFKADYTATDSPLPGQLATMSAFANKEVYLMMPNNAYDANVEMYFANAYFALTVAYPDVYGANGTNPINLEAKVKEIMTHFYGKEMYDEILVYGGYQKLNLPDQWPV